MTDKIADYYCLKCNHRYKDKPGPTQCPKCGHLYVKWLNYGELKKEGLINDGSDPKSIPSPKTEPGIDHSKAHGHRLFGGYYKRGRMP